MIVIAPTQQSAIIFVFITDSMTRLPRGLLGRAAKFHSHRHVFFFLFITLLISPKLLILKRSRYWLAPRGISNSYCRSTKAMTITFLSGIRDEMEVPWSPREDPPPLPGILLFFYRRSPPFSYLPCVSFPSVAFYFSFIATERADYNCKCYHKPDLTPARGEMNWHVGVKLRAESAGGPHDERRAPASVVNGPEE